MRRPLPFAEAILLAPSLAAPAHSADLAPEITGTGIQWNNHHIATLAGLVRITDG